LVTVTVFESEVVKEPVAPVILLISPVILFLVNKSSSDNIAEEGIVGINNLLAESADNLIAPKPSANINELVKLDGTLTPPIIVL
jgi:hypothetical protein